MTVEMFHRSLSNAAPPDAIGLALQALWWARHGDWARAHACVQQQEGDPDCDLVHAHLHRQEGDGANAAAWYRDAGRAVPEMSLTTEWTELAAELLSRGERRPQP